MNFLASGINVVSVNPEAFRVSTNLVCTGTVTASSLAGNIVISNTYLPNTIAADIVGNLTGDHATIAGNIASAYVFGNGAFMTGVSPTLPGTVNADIVGNVTGAKSTMTGNVSAAYFIGNGALLSGVNVGNVGLPNTIAAEIVGNLTGDHVVLSGNLGASYVYASVVAPLVVGMNVAAISLVAGGAFAANSRGAFTSELSATGNARADTFVGNFAGDHATLAGNATAAYFSGNGALLTGLVVGNASLPKTVAADVSGNLTGEYVTVTGRIAANVLDVGDGDVLAGYVESNRALFDALEVNGNVIFDSYILGDNATLTGNASASYFKGNGALLTGVLVGNMGLPNTIAAEIVGNLTGDHATLRGNVAGTYFFGNVVGQLVEASNVIAFTLVGGTGFSANNRGAFASSLTATGDATADRFVGNLVGATATLTGNATADTFVGNLVGGEATLAGNASASYFKGNGALLTGVLVGNMGLPNTIAAEIVGNLTGDHATLRGNVVGTYFFGNVVGQLVEASNIVGFTLVGGTGFSANSRGAFASSLTATGDATADRFVGNLVGGTADLSGNATAAYFVGNGAFLTGVAKVSEFGVIHDDVLGNVDGEHANFGGNVAAANFVGNGALLSGNVEAAYFVGNGALLTGLITGLPSTITADLTGNVSGEKAEFAGNVRGLHFSGDAALLTGNVSASYFLGNGALLTGISVGAIANTLTADVVGNLTGTDVALSGNATAAYFLGNGALLTGISVGAIANTLTTDIIGNLAGTTATLSGNATAAYFIGNGELLTGLSLTNIAIPDTIVGNNATLRGITRSEVYYGNSVQVWNLAGNNAYVSGMLQGNAGIFSGNVTASYLKGNGALLTDVVVSNSSLPKTLMADLSGNVTGTNLTMVGNLYGVSVDVTQGVYANSFEGNTALFNELDVNGNVNVFTDSYFIGNGAMLTGVVVGNAGLPKSIAADIAGNVFGNSGAFSGNVSAAYFFGNGALLTGIVVSNASLPRTLAADISGNVTGSRVSVVGNLYGTSIDVTQGVYANSFEGNTALFNELDVNGNINVFTDSYFIGNGAMLTGVVVGNTGLPKTIRADLAGNVAGNAASFEGNVTALRFIGNGALLTGVPAGNVLVTDTLVLGNLATTANVNAERVSANALTVRGNVVSAANVDAERMSANVLTVRGNVNSSGWMTVAGNVSATNFIGSGALLTGLTSGACFVPPSTGITSNIAGAVAYSAATGWTISLQQSTPTWVTISAYSMPMTPDAPLMGVPASVTQTMTTPFAFAPATGLWTGTVRLTALELFAPVNASIGGSTAFGTFGGNSNAMQATGVTLISVTGVRPSPRGGGNGYSGGSYIDPVTGSIAMNVYATANYTVTQWGQTLLGGNVYHIVTDKNLTAISYINRVVGPVGGYGRTCKGAHYVSMTELYVAFVVNSANASVPVYDKTATSANATGGTAFVAKVNPVANTCSWWVSVTPNITGGWQQYPLLTASPDGTKIALAGGVLATTVTSVNMRRDGGGAATTYTYPRGNTLYYNGFTTFLYASNGVPVNGGVAMTCYQATPTGYQWETWQQTHAWSPDSAFFSMQVSTSEQAGQTWGYWNGTSMVDKTTFYSGFSPGAGTICATIIFPVGNLVSAPWGSERVTPSVMAKDAGYYGAAAWGGDGNLWTVMNTYKQVSTGETTTFTYGGSSLTTPSTALYNVGSLFIWRGRIDPATSAYAASSVASYKTTTTDASGIQALTAFESIALAPYPYANSSSMRMVFSTSQGTMTLGGVACTGLTINQSRAVTVDMTSGMTVSNFKTITGNTAYVTEFQSGQLLRGPASDSGYTLAVGSTYGWKQSSTGGG